MSAPARTKALTPSLARLERIKAERPAAPAGTETGSRRARRKQTSLPAMLTFATMRVTVPCIVADMSSTGAKISIAAEALAQFGDIEQMPERLTLVLRADRMQVDCEVKWRKAGKVGVLFLSPPRPLEPARR